MLNYKSIRSSEPQIRSNPALRQVNEKSGFQKRLSTLLEPISLPFPTFQIFKDMTKSILENHTHYAWIRPAHLRSTWIILGDEMPLIMLDPRDEKRKFSLRIPFDKRKIQHTGPIIMEGSWDAQDHVLWIWDVVFYEKENVWDSKPYSKRWEILKNILNTILDCGHPMSDAEVKVPEWQSLESLINHKELDTATSVEFQPEKPAKRRILYLVKGDDVKYNPSTHHERKMQATPQIQNKYNAQPGAKEHKNFEKTQIQNVRQPKENKIILINDTSSEKSETKSESIKSATEENKTIQITEKQRVARLTKDTLSKLPDTYRLKTIDNEDLGLAAIRSLGISKQIREQIKVKDYIMVDIQWFEPFQKYEIKKIHT
jgi:hypothetical protein